MTSPGVFFADINLACSYEFDTFLVHKDIDGDLFFATDSGCSCPIPFNNHVFPDDWTKITSEKQFNEDFERWLNYGHSKNPELAKVMKIKQMVASYLREQNK